MTISLGFLTLHPLSAAVLLALLAGMPILLRLLPVSVTADLMLAGLAGALIGGRALHVLLNWGYFAAHPGEAVALYAGGLDWHGAVIGGLVGVRGYLALTLNPSPSGRGTLRRRIFSPLPQGGGWGERGNLLDALAPLLPLLALAAWAGCAASACGYGAEVPTLADYPAFAVSESRDVYGITAPRWNTPLFGVALALVVGLIVLACAWRGWARGRRLWLALALLSAGMFALGFVRGDYSPNAFNIRVDQLLDIGLFVFSAAAFLTQRRKDAETQSSFG